MSSDSSGAQRGRKKRNRGRGKGRGQQQKQGPEQSESIPGGLEQASSSQRGEPSGLSGVETAPQSEGIVSGTPLASSEKEIEQDTSSKSVPSQKLSSDPASKDEQKRAQQTGTDVVLPPSTAQPVLLAQKDSKLSEQPRKQDGEQKMAQQQTGNEQTLPTTSTTSTDQPVAYQKPPPPEASSSRTRGKRGKKKKPQQVSRKEEPSTVATSTVPLSSSKEHKQPAATKEPSAPVPRWVTTQGPPVQAATPPAAQLPPSATTTKQPPSPTTKLVPSTSMPLASSTTVSPPSAPKPVPSAATPSTAKPDSSTIPRQTPSTPEESKTKTSQPARGANDGGARPKRQAQPPTSLPAGQVTGRSSEPDLRPPKRPDKGGTVGRPIRLQVNFFEIKLPKDDIHHYDTDIKVEGSQKWDEGFTASERPNIIKAMVQLYERECPDGPRLVYDRNGKNVYCRKEIPKIGKEREFQVSFTTDHGKDRKYIVKVKWVSRVSLHCLQEALNGKLTEIPLDTIQAINTVLCHLPSMQTIRHRSCFYDYPGDRRMPDITGGVECWSGRFLSARPTKWKMVLNVDTCSAGFYRAQPVLHFLCEFLGFRDIPRSLNRKQHKIFEKEMKGIKVETTHMKRKQKVNGLSPNGLSATEQSFDCDGRQTTVFEYFKVTYKIVLQYPGLPCVKMGQRSFIPMELCNILPNQRKDVKLTPEQTAAMIRHTALPAPQRREKICQLVRNSGFDQDPYARDFGIKVNPNMTAVNGRVLPPPKITYGPEQQLQVVTPRDGKWDMQQVSFRPVELKEWAIVSCAQFLNDDGIGFFIKCLVDGGQAKGLRIHPSSCYRKKQCNVEQIKTIFAEISKRYPKLQMLFVILPEPTDRDRRKVNLTEYYEAVKQYGDVVYGITTQCIAAKTAKDKARDKQTIANICLKINAKLGGTTSVLTKEVKSKILKRPVIIFGADVTHPSPGDKSAPSIAAVVASMDPFPNHYSAEVRVQKRRQERIDDLKDIVKGLLKKFKMRTNVKPEKIIFYRDGVDEGQFKLILIHELQAIQHACRELQEDYKPEITFIVVKKRHHALFFATNPQDQDRGKSKNIPAGTVIDQDVCHPTEFDWYLCSHAGIQGTSKSVHYHVLYDDSDFTSDDLEILSHQLCHTYVRCARSVSIPAPVYYAHHVAFRARYHLNKVASSSGSAVGVDESDGLPTDEMIRAVKVHDYMSNRMYFA